jgi:hypothetical protein
VNLGDSLRRFKLVIRSSGLGRKPSAVSAVGDSGTPFEARSTTFEVRRIDCLVCPRATYSRFGCSSTREAPSTKYQVFWTAFVSDGARYRGSKEAHVR